MIEITCLFWGLEGVSLKVTERERSFQQLQKKDASLNLSKGHATASLCLGVTSPELKGLKRVKPSVVGCHHV